MLKLLLITLAIGCAHPITRTVIVANPFIQENQEFNYEIIVPIRDLRSPEGLASSSHLSGVNYGNNNQNVNPSYIHPKYLIQKVKLTKVTSSGLEIQVLLSADWAELADLEHYRIQLVIDGQELIPISIRQRKTNKDHSVTYQSIKKFQTINIHHIDKTSTHWETWGPEEYDVSGTTYRSNSVLEFEHSGVFTSRTKQLKLLLTSRERSFIFVWNFER